MIEAIREFTIESEIHRAAFSPDGRWLALATKSGTTELWEIPTATPGPILHGHSDDVWTVSFAPDGRTIATGGGDGTVRIWNSIDGRERALFRGHSRAVTAAAFIPDGRRLVTSGWDHRLIVWDVAAGSPLANHDGGATLEIGGFSADGIRLLIGSDRNQAELWHSDAGRVRVLTGKNSDSTMSTAVSRRAPLAFTAEKGVRVPPGQPANWFTRVGVWDASAWRELRDFEVGARPHRGVWHLAASGDGRFILLGHSDGIVKVVRSATGEVGFERSVCFEPEAMSLSADDTVLVSTVGRRVQLWKVQVPHWEAPRKPWWRFW
ncbi:WD40 repeat domain-containing protein [Urbifossiella limnaea]|uniref:WD domain, G-beta repeat n=1 Tax=Urbifossiella limnaea TaxID=2528023 RepID=A0A517Y1Y9_9BACT|nr:PD40 domain-containing protein [Urbifossiella limnaea]QDU23775.1 WD domain, G-beta repeat [Urbifossiella limnaea]